MSIDSQISNDGLVHTIAINGRFDFSLNRAFREIYQQPPKDVGEYVIDLGNTVYMDSSALGMLLLLRDHAKNRSADMSIINCSLEIKKILEIANFNKIFDIK